jgi:hypothetical protein
MGEYLRRDSSDPSFVPDGKGAGADVGKMLQAAALAQQLGKSVEEVLAFMGAASNVSVPVVPAQTAIPQPLIALPPALQDAKVFLPTEDAAAGVIPEDAKGLAPKVTPKGKAVADDTGFVVTETVDAEQATEKELDELFPDEEENNWDGKIREGSKVKVTYSVPGSKIKWQGKIGKVVRVIGNEKAKVFEVEFKGQKIPKVRLNKKTGKLERGYVNKRLVTTFDQEDIELYS